MAKIGILSNQTKNQKNNLVLSLKYLIFAVILWWRNTSESLELSRNCESGRISQSICHKRFKGNKREDVTN